MKYKRGDRITLFKPYVWINSICDAHNRNGYLTIKSIDKKIHPNGVTCTRNFCNGEHLAYTFVEDESKFPACLYRTDHDSVLFEPRRYVPIDKPKKFKTMNR